MLEKLSQHLNIEKDYQASFEHGCHELGKSRIGRSLELELSESAQKLCYNCTTPPKQTLSWTPRVLQRELAAPAGLARAGGKAGVTLQEACHQSAQCSQ